MSYPQKVKQRAIELSTSQGRSAGSVIQQLEMEFPPQDIPNERTVRRWLKESPTRQHSSYLDRLIAEHSEKMIEVANALLAQGLDILTGDGNPYYNIGYAELFFEDLGVIFRGNVKAARVRFGDDVDCLLTHLKAEFHKMSVEEFAEEIESSPDPIAQVKALQVLVKRKTLKGICPTCESWHKK